MNAALLLLAVLASQKGAPVAGDKLAPFTVRTASEQPFSWKPGRTTVLSFCAYWCDTWKTQAPRLQQAEQALRGLPVDFYTVSIDGRWTDLAKPGGWTPLSDPGGAWSKSIGIDLIPYTFVVDAASRVRWAAFGVVRTQTVLDQVRSAMQPLEETGAVYLTFDDFPSGKREDDLLLDALRRAAAPATLFCIGRNIEGRETVMRRAIAEGHSLQVHSWAHDKAVPHHDFSLGAFARLGVTPTLYRPPGTQDILTMNGHPRKMPSMTPYDYLRPGASEITRRILLGLKPGIVIQLHAGVGQTVDALPEVIRGIRARGFAFDVLR